MPTLATDSQKYGPSTLERVKATQAKPSQVAGAFVNCLKTHYFGFKSC